MSPIYLKVSIYRQGIKQRIHWPINTAIVLELSVRNGVSLLARSTRQDQQDEDSFSYAMRQVEHM